MTAGDSSESAGLQAERTRLAWRRTTLAATVTWLVGAGRLATDGTRPPALAGTALCALLWLALLVVAHRRSRALTVRSVPPAARRAPAILALLTVALAAAGILLVPGL